MRLDERLTAVPWTAREMAEYYATRGSLTVGSVKFLPMLAPVSLRAPYPMSCSPLKSKTAWLFTP